MINYLFIVIGGFCAFLLPVVPLATIIILSGKRQFDAHTTKQLKQSVENQMWFWIVRAMLHIIIAIIIGSFAYEWQLPLPLFHLFLVAMLGTLFHYGVHVLQGISIKALVVEKRAYDIPLFMLLGLYVGYYLTSVVMR